MSGSIGLRLRDIAVGKKIGLLLVAMLVVSGISAAVVWQNVSANEKSGTAVNVAGSNRMLSQRLAFISFMIKDGHSDEEMLNTTVSRVDSNLEALDAGGTVNGQQVPPAPPEARDELKKVQSDWPKLRTAADTVAETEAYDPEFVAAEEYVIRNNDQLLTQSNDVVVAYKEADTSGQYSDEIDVAGRQRMLSQRIAKLVTTISSKSQVQGAEASEVLEHQDSEEMQRLRDELRAAVDEYDSALDALESGGRHEGMTLQPAPASVRDELETVRGTWEPFREEATTAATVDKLNPEFWRALGTLEGGADPFRGVNDDLTGEIAQVSRERSATMQRILLVLLGVNAAVFVGGFVLTRRTVSHPLRQMRDEAERIASKDLTTSQVDCTDRGDEIGELGCSFSDMLGNLRTMVTELKSNSATVASSAEELAAANEETNAASEEVATMVQEINDAAQQQAEQAEKAARQLQELSDHAKTISRSAERAEDVSRAAKEKAEEGGNAAVEAMDTMEEIQEVVDDSADEVQELGEKSDEIGRIVDVITEMAEQTNLLALNAAIEAARAGEQGKGFAVVAEEIRSLAEESTEAASQISDLIDEIQGQTDDAVVSMRQGTEKVSDGTEVVNDALSALQEITGSVQETSGKVQEISGAAERQADMVREAASSIDDISSKAEETADNTEDVSAAAEEQTASMQQVSSSAQELSGISEELKAMVDEFEVDEA